MRAAVHARERDDAGGDPRERSEPPGKRGREHCSQCERDGGVAGRVAEPARMLTSVDLGQDVRGPPTVDEPLHYLR